jgi:iron complex outermembrane receptor protein
LKAKAGISYELAEENINLKDYQKLFDDAKMSRYFPIAALTATFNDRFLEEFRYKLIAEIASEPVQSEQLFIFVKKPKRPKPIPDWIGNPSLNQNIKSSFKTSLNYYDIEIGCGLTKIWDYVETGVMNYESLKYQTFKNIDAVIFNSYIKANWQYYDFYITYLWGENVHTKQPLSEIIPLTLIETIKIPDFYNLSIFLKHTYNNAQKRVNNELFENQSKAWNKIDLGINYRLNHFVFGVIAENLTNELYSNHLSYLRNPFSTGLSVYEPGFSISFNVYYEM